MSEKFNTTPDWWLEQSPVWLTMARQYMRLQSAQAKRDSDESQMRNELQGFANRVGGGRWEM